MKNNFKRFLAAILTVAFCAAAEADVMLWAINGASVVDSNPSMNLTTFISTSYAEDTFGVRIGAYDSAGNLIRYLNPIYGDPAGSMVIDWDYNDELVGSAEDLFGAKARQAYSEDGKDLMVEQMFQMEIGKYDDDYNFSAFLYSDVDKVDGKHIYRVGGLDPIGTDWKPNKFYTARPVYPVPEPSSGVLLLAGAAVIMLRRRPERRDV